MIDFAPFRLITLEDNAAAAAVIREVMTDNGLYGEGYSIHDPEVDDMYGAYSDARSAFYVLPDADGRLIGVGGIAPLIGADASICELRKMYFRPAARGRGLGKQLLTQLLVLAKAYGYEQMYLESAAHLNAAIGLYERCGFQHIDAPMGNTGHSVCDVLMVRDV